jgi:hypothetical protein
VREDLQVSDIGAQDDWGRVFLKAAGPECVEVSFQPSRRSYAEYRPAVDKALNSKRPTFDGATGAIYYGAIEAFRRALDRIPNKKLARLDRAKGTISTYPTIRRPSSRLLRPKYLQIEEIVLEDLQFDLPRDESEIEEEIYELPDGFIRYFKFGLGLRKLFNPIIEAVSGIDTVRSLVLREGPTGVNDTYYYLSYADYERIRSTMNSIQTRSQAEALIDRRFFAHNAILTEIDALSFPARARRHEPGAVASILGNAKQPTRLSELDQQALIEGVAKHAREISKEQPERLMKLRQDIELVTLDQLIEQFDSMLARTTSEHDWQTLFKLNPFILTMAFGYPIVLLTQQGHVGGTDLAGRGGKIADFVTKNDQTHNVALVEIKKPGTKLILDEEYRDGVHKIAPDFANSVLQVLDQRYRFVTHIAALQCDSRGDKFEGYSVDCVVVAGRTPDNADRQKALELYRGAFKDVSVLTFDELRQRLVTLRNFLSSDCLEPLATADTPLEMAFP